MGVQHFGNIAPSHTHAYACGEARVSSPTFSTHKPPVQRGRRALIQAAVSGSSKAERKLREPDGSFGLPLLGESLDWVKDLSSFFAQRHVLILMVWPGELSSTNFAPATCCL